jgi:ribosomal protein S18 acetylase RimI-like enzyme
MSRPLVTHLEMRSPDQLRPAPPTGLEVRRAEVPSPELNRFFYTAVGGDWFWIEKLHWTYEQWRAFVDRPGFATWIALVQGTPAGYFELEQLADGAVEIAHFGLLPAFTGQGHGGHLLTLAVREAWARGATRVQLNTNERDHPRALANYQKRGFTVTHTAPADVDYPDTTPGPWPGARPAPLALAATPGGPPPPTPPDTLNRVGVLTRREIEARILAPFVDALSAHVPRPAVVAVLRETVIATARRQGAELARAMGGNDLAAFERSLEAWTRDDALQLRVLERGADRLHFDVTRCRYAELYRALGVAELGAVLSCNRDAALIDGFNPDVRLTRTQTIMQGASCCDFRYVRAGGDASGGTPD